MQKIIISGCNGRMGQTVKRMCAEDPDVTVVAGFDLYGETQNDFEVFAQPDMFTGEADVIIDFSNPSALEGLLDYVRRTKTPVVLCTTGYSQEQLDAIRKAATEIPIFKSGNMSLGISVVSELLKRATTLLADNYDIEIVERHHNKKVDAPSGTALMLADAISSALPYEPEYVYERESRRQPRGKHEVGISAIRGGTIVGVHEVIFAGPDEVIEIKHTAYSREVFAAGAVQAAKYLAGITTPGIYDMNDLIADK